LFSIVLQAKTTAEETALHLHNLLKTGFNVRTVLEIRSQDTEMTKFQTPILRLNYVIRLAFNYGVVKVSFFFPKENHWKAE